MPSKKAVEYAAQAGALLNRAKERVGHGEWEEWVRANCYLAPRTARGYMQLAAVMTRLSSEERQTVADSPLRQALMAIGDSSEPVNTKRPAPRNEESTAVPTPDPVVAHEPGPSYCIASPVRFVVDDLPAVTLLDDRDLLVFLNEIADNGVATAKSFLAHCVDDRIESSKLSNGRAGHVATDRQERVDA